ncbi:MULTISPECIES: 30S ribosomal protein S4 [Auritidibacter]|uniref:30S ribosomal protein S4 n=1 Tax=Auritidibacter TaxID=1160973 RepID=UPI000D737511|nr:MULTISPECIES: 30S ribosomal protein S4 [Auritidibacter]PXA77949.1 30S ribosomal protein S4 [Auritidibacter sp. NML100628]WGH84516.1 30S ribosomal protein S4 [Auritidibacter ignavus]WGH86831.1 30S ribosomal protein S4 [Auritidibacter ignavus]WGH89115.1 30S ribosomal protein S4 [Auritidibacter ignavus]WHS34738.1 30S ribosomal protein S4 [Auritidibacter ignavus]
MTKNLRSRRTVRHSRALGIALTPKAEKYMERRPYGPGQHGRARRRADSDYSVRLKEKQRLRALYNVREAQMRRYFAEAKRRSGQAGENLITLLESRLDALVLRAGFARTIAQARQLVVHRHILVDGQRVDRPSFQVKEGQLIHVHERSETMVPFQIAATGAHQEVLPDVPGYLDVEIDKLRARLVRTPERSEVPVSIQENLVVEHYSR